LAATVEALVRQATTALEARVQRYMPPDDAFAIALTDTADGRVQGHTSRDYWNQVGPYGGITAAVVLQAILRRPDVGRLAVGAKSDFSVVELKHPYMRPVREPLRVRDGAQRDLGHRRHAQRLLARAGRRLGPAGLPAAQRRGGCLVDHVRPAVRLPHAQVHLGRRNRRAACDLPEAQHALRQLLRLGLRLLRRVGRGVARQGVGAPRRVRGAPKSPRDRDDLPPEGRRRKG
jgi:hypothetical protein